MRQAANGDTVLVHYRGTFADGTEFDSSANREPLQVTIGSGQVIPGFDGALVGMVEGDTRNITLEPDDAYGPQDPELVHVVERERIPADIDLHIGTLLQAMDSGGNQVQLQVVGLSDADVTLDTNHPLAGKALTFELKLVEIAS